MARPLPSLNRSVALLVLTIASIGAYSCAGATHLTREKKLPSGPDSGNTILIDAKQRAITNAIVNGSLRVCAEPSPDAISAIAASAGMTLSKGEAAQIATNLSLAEGVGSIGLRTQSIQLMRDAMYRLCEGYVSGAIDGLAFETLQRRFQSSMVAILAIEQLTGAVRAPAVVLGATATEGNAERAADLTEKTEAARKALADARKDQQDKQTASDKAKSDREALEKELADLKAKTPSTDPKEKAKDDARMAELGGDSGLIAKATAAEKTAGDAVDDAKKSTSDREASYKALDSARLVALAGGGSAAVTGQISPSELSHPDTTGLASAVQEIVKATLNLEFGRELCTTLLTKPNFPNTNTMMQCQQYLVQTVEALADQRAVMNALIPLIENVGAILKDPKANAETLKTATDLLAGIQKLADEAKPTNGTRLLAQ